MGAISVVGSIRKYLWEVCILISLLRKLLSIFLIPSRGLVGRLQVIKSFMIVSCGCPGGGAPEPIGVLRVIFRMFLAVSPVWNWG